jgi:hypothetical protein
VAGLTLVLADGKIFKLYRGQKKAHNGLLNMFHPSAVNARSIDKTRRGISHGAGS